MENLIDNPVLRQHAKEYAANNDVVMPSEVEAAYIAGANDIVEKFWELFQQYATYTHPRKNTEVCVMNKSQFINALNK